MNGIRFKIYTLLFSLASLLATADLNAAEDKTLTRILSKSEAALVTVKYVLFVNMGSLGRGKETETESELTCSMISEDGLLVCSSIQLLGFMGMMSRLNPAGANNMSAIPRDFKVLVGEQDESFDAEIVAKDTELDITWLQVTNAGGQTFSFVDFSEAAPVDIGEPVFLVRRLGNSFGRAAAISRSHIGGITNKPRKLYIPGMAPAGGAGLPVFSADGRPVGLMVIQLPEIAEGSDPLKNVFGSGMANMQEAMSGLILPASDVAKATRRAKEMMASQE